MIIYIAGPYSKGDVAQNVKNAIDAADALIELGHTPYLPHLTHFWHIISPKRLQFWYDYDYQFLPFCDALLRIPGASLGADNEVDAAKRLCIPIFYSLEEVANWK